MLRRPFFALPMWATFALSTASCGHPATVQECEEIIARIAELEMKERNIPEGEIQDEIAATKERLKESTMQDCVGKRITEGAMQCVRSADESKKVVACFH